MRLRVPTLALCALITVVITPALAIGDVLPTGPVSGGGAFVMQTCGESGSSEGWSFTNPPSSTLAGGVECPPQRGHDPAFPERTQQSGLWVSDRLLDAGGSGDTPADTGVELSFLTAPQTAISRIRFWRMVSKDFDNDWEPYIARGDGPVVDSCSLGGTSSCNEGGDSWYPYDEYGTINNTGYSDLQGFSSTGITVGLHCKPNPTGACGNGSSITYADAAIYSAFFTISDPSDPALGAPAGEGWSTGAWSEGTLPLVLSSSDNTGISATRVYADGSLIATLQRSCHYDRPKPCTDEPGGAVGLPTAGLGDGLHSIEVAAVDAAGNETRVARSAPLRVDRTAPAAPVGLASPAPASETNGFSASWSLPSDAGSPIVGARYQLCQSGRCSEVRTAPSPTGINGLALSDAGDATLRVWLVDALGHADPSHAATVALSYRPPVPLGPATPVPPPDQPGLDPPVIRSPVIARSAAALKLSTVRRVGRKVTVSGRLTSKASGRITVRYGVRLGARTRTITRHVPIRSGAFRTLVTLSQTIAKARSATITVTYGGDADTKAASVRSTLRVRTR